MSVEIGRTFKVTMYVLTAPLAAVTTAVNVLFPSIKPDLPETTTTDSASSAVATTVTTRVNGGRAIVPLSVAARPLTVKVERLVFVLSGATTALMVITLIVFKSGAVTVTTTSLDPTNRPVRPVMFTLAAGSRVIATTLTDVVRERSWTMSPSTTSAPFKVNVVRAVSAEAPPTRTVNETTLVVPSWAVMVTVTRLSPSMRSSLPAITTVANSFPVSTDTSTEEVSGSTVTTSPETVSMPSTEIIPEASLEGTKIITLYSAVVSPSGAVTVTRSSFSPATSSVPPTTSKLDSDLTVSTTTSTEVVLSSVS